MKNLDSFGQWFRAIIWRVMLVVFLAVCIHELAEGSETLSAFEEPQGFWPPDMVPHPEFPHPVPEYDPNDPNDERNWA